ncbi:MAG: hypothetical protein LBH26_04090 [Treponema sp.]|nr:hypothetical protein [Treponema sp.]
MDFINKFINRVGGFPKTSASGKAALNLWEKAGFRPLFQGHFPKPTGFWEMPIIKRLLFKNFIIINNRRVQEPGWFPDKSCRMLCILPFLSGCRGAFL